ncbi:MAG: homoserine O-acetyltransferase [Bacteroidales bacterium]|nr:homoserine O-acetyltransferase [Bacteroidales bacterium]
MDKNHYYHHGEAFALEAGNAIKDLRIAYQHWGKLNEKQDNVIWVCHAYTANADAADWWPGMIGSGLLLDTDKYFVICANVVGSCYGSTGPLDINPETEKPWLKDFPKITVRDVVNAHEILCKHLKIKSIYMIIGGSIGAFQALEWSIMFPERIQHMVFIASSASASPWNIAQNEAQRLAVMADPTYFSNDTKGGLNGLKAARAMALISYRNAETYNSTQKDGDVGLSGNYKAISYQRYQGEKLVKRYNAYSYVCMSHLFDSHHIGRNRASVEQVLGAIKAKTLVIALDSDQLFPPEEQQFVAKHIPNAEFERISTGFAHDGFLIESEQITHVVNRFLNNSAS